MKNSRKDNKGRVLRKGESQRKDGRYIYQYRDPLGKPKVIYARDLSELRLKERSVEKDKLDGIRTYSDGNATLNYAFDRYMATKYDLKESTRINYTYMYDKIVRNSFGRRQITSIMYSEVKFFYQSILESGMKANTLDTIHTVIHPVFSMAVRDGIIRTNPSDGVMSEIKKQAGKNKGVRHALTREQQKAFLDYVENSLVYCHWLPLFTVLFGTGGRIGEIIGLRWQDIDYDNRQISINHSLIYLCHGKGTASFKVSTPKTEAGTRTIQ